MTTENDDLVKRLREAISPLKLAADIARHSSDGYTYLNDFARSLLLTLDALVHEAADRLSAQGEPVSGDAKEIVDRLRSVEGQNRRLAIDAAWMIEYLFHRAGTAPQPSVVSEGNEAELYVPGEFCCTKCGFTLSQFSLAAQTGAITSRDHPGEKCPNDGAPLWRVTWKQLALDHYDRAIVEMQRANAAEAMLDASPVPSHCSDNQDDGTPHASHLTSGRSYEDGVRDALVAVKNEQMEDAQPGGDHPYARAIENCVTAIEALTNREGA